MSALRKYRAIFQTTLVNSLAYPGELVGRSLMILPFMWIFYQLWKVTFAASGSNSINGLSLHDTMWYLMMAETIELSRPRVARTIADNVKDGSIAYLLNKPYSFLLYQMAVGLGDSAVRIGFNAVAGGALIWATVGPPPDVRGWPLALVAVAAAWLIDFCLSATIGLAAFVTEDIAAFEWIYAKVQFLLGGLLIPLDFYPAWLRSINFILFIGALRAGGDTRYAMFMELFSIWAIGVPAALIGGFVLRLPVYGVYALVLLEELVKVIIISRRYLSRKWIHNLVNVGAG